jgi:hypothetical protein
MQPGVHACSMQFVQYSEQGLSPNLILLSEVYPWNCGAYLSLVTLLYGHVNSLHRSLARCISTYSYAASLSQLVLPSRASRDLSPQPGGQHTLLLPCLLGGEEEQLGWTKFRSTISRARRRRKQR